MPGAHQPLMEFHVSRQARERYGLDESLFSLRGVVVLSDFYAAREFARRMNLQRDLVRFPEQAVKAGQINAMGLIDEILHYVAALYRRQKNPAAMHEALVWLGEELGREAVDQALRSFAREFPPTDVYRGEVDAEAYLEGESDGVSHRQVVLEEMLMLGLANVNPALSPFKELFEDVALRQETAYGKILPLLREFFLRQPTFGPEDQGLVDMLRSPAVAEPDSLAGQLVYIRERWGYLLGEYLLRLLGGLDLIKEEEKVGLPGPGPALVYEFAELEQEPERFSRDLDWMPRLVLIAKNAYVWLDQLSRRYGRPIQRLDQIPDEELDTLARWGISGLWLIGLWERSRASQRIKELCGSPEPAPSAYSLFDYQIAAELGGEQAHRNLQGRAWERGIRLASDMVPNHMGIDSRWLIEHPDWFISLDHSPFPGYIFSGPDLSWDGRVGIHLEDHYYNHSDAAVVFKRVDRWTGDVRYVYHGNDGTSMPWNDTAQLDYMKAEVREAVIQTILHVARLFPIIRFDAAMTLAKKHYQRLWFPEPGSGGAIPSRAEHGLSRAQFHARMPEEFWREVVDRVAQEAPHTLLLAEAFWLMEGYFVRTLGMHRVYNSAFMNMLRDEENANYRTVIKNVLAFDPEILKRFVNFMNNPDEETAVSQFGKDDKYFGICTMMATMPGLPMFGHGQIEGFTEKYGMEYRRAYWDEQPDPHLVARHEREIFPLLHRRRLFAGVQHFLLYDFFTPEGYVNEDVFAYSNRAGHERTLVLYHNRYATARGWIRSSVTYSFKTGQGDERMPVQKNLGEGLGLHSEEGYFCIFRDHVAGLEYLRSSKELFEKGLYVELGAYKYHVFLDFREVRDDERQAHARLAAVLGGGGVPSVEQALLEQRLRPVHEPFKALVNGELFRRLIDAGVEAEVTLPPSALPLLDEVEQSTARLLGAVREFVGLEGDGPGVAAVAGEVRRKLEVILRWPALAEGRGLPRAGPAYRAAGQQLRGGPSSGKPLREDDPALWGTMLGWLFTHALGKAVDASGFVGRGLSWIDEWGLNRVLADALRDLGLDVVGARRAVATVRLLVDQQRWFDLPGPAETRPYRVSTMLLGDSEVQRFLQVNRFEGMLWFNKERFEELLWWMLWLAAVEGWADPQWPAGEAVAQITGPYQIVETLRRAEKASEYQVEKLLTIVEETEEDDAADP